MTSILRSSAWALKKSTKSGAKPLQVEHHEPQKYRRTNSLFSSKNIAAIIVVVVFFVNLVVAATAAAGGSHHHKLLLNLETLKFSTDTWPLIATVPQFLVHVEILVDLVEIFGGDIGRFGVGWSEMEQDLRGADRLSRGEEPHYTRN
jgi:hypothetical protein